MLIVFVLGHDFYNLLCSYLYNQVFHVLKIIIIIFGWLSC